MGFPSSVTDLADKVSGVLGQGPAAPGAAASAAMKKVDATYKVAGDIDDAGTNKPGATALNHLNIYDPKLPIHFIHFGYFHTDGYDNFHHDNLQDDKAAVLPAGNTGSRGIMFRAALAREAVLINAFISCAASIAQEMTASSQSKGPASLLKGMDPSSLSSPMGGMGAIQNAAGAVGGLLGGNSGTSAAPDASALKPYQSAVQTAGGKINVTALKYLDMHQTGIDLHQDWLNFDGFVPSMAKSTTNQAGSGVLGNIPGTLSGLGVPSLGAASDIIGILTGVLFSMFDIYQGMYQNLRAKLEPVIREQCYQRSIAAIKSSWQPIYDVWSVTPDQSTTMPNPKPDHKEKVVDAGTGTGADRYLADPLSKVNNPYDQGLNSIDSASQSLDGARQSWDSFWSAPVQKEGPGNDQLTAITGAFKDPTSDVFAAFVSTIRNQVKSVTDNTFPLTIVNKILSIIVPACCQMLGDIIIQLQDPAFVKGGITQDSFDAAGRIYIRTKLSDLILGTGIVGSLLGPVNGIISGAQDTASSAFSGAKTGLSGALGSVPGVGNALNVANLPGQKTKDLDQKSVVNKALGIADSLAGKNLNPIMDFAMGSLHTEFTDTLAQVDQNSLVMEVFLGQLPLLITSLVRNIFFPFFQMLVEKVLGPLGGLANLASSPVNDLMSSARDKDRDVKKGVGDVTRNVNNDANFAKQWLGHGYTVQGQQVDNPLGDTINSAADGASGFANQYLGQGGSDSNSQSPASSSGGGFPGSARKNTCSVIPVTKADYDQVDGIDNGLLLDHKLTGAN
jgi:hypothetical protein